MYEIYKQCAYLKQIYNTCNFLHTRRSYLTFKGPNKSLHFIKWYNKGHEDMFTIQSGKQKSRDHPLGMWLFYFKYQVNLLCSTLNCFQVNNEGNKSDFEFRQEKLGFVTKHPNLSGVKKT